MKITLLGSGNVATFFGKALFKQGWCIHQVYSPTLLNAAILSKELNAHPVDQLSKIDDQADIYLVAVKDDAMLQLSESKALSNKIIIHCSGSNRLEFFQHISTKLGVIWPIYSVKKEQLPKHRNVPLIIDATDDVLLSLMERLAYSVSDSVKQLDNTDRGKLHLNAVLVNNFTNHLYAMAESICVQSNIDFSILIPIMQQGIEHATKGHFAELQTGPAVRQDWVTIEKHINLLASFGLSSDVYKTITQSIIDLQSLGK